MNYKNILVTGGAGFIGSHACIGLKKKFPASTVIAFDNLARKGSHLNIPPLKEHGVQFVKGDVRNKLDLSFPEIDLLVECSAEASVMAGVTSSPEYVVQTNLVGALNCFELVRLADADIVFLSTSRVYPVTPLNNLNIVEQDRRFTLGNKQSMPGSSDRGISEQFSLNGVRTLYGATKLAAEHILQEYIHNYNIGGIINRFGLVSGPGQMGKIDQGVIALWIGRHLFRLPISYIGFGGKGKQVRDVLHVADVVDVLLLQLDHLSTCTGNIYNIGGGLTNSISLHELTTWCQEKTGNHIPITVDKNTRPGDVRIYISDNSLIEKDLDWKPKRSIEQTLSDTYEWMNINKEMLRPIFTQI